MCKHDSKCFEWSREKNKKEKERLRSWPHSAEQIQHFLCKTFFFSIKISLHYFHKTSALSNEPKPNRLRNFRSIFFCLNNLTWFSFSPSNTQAICIVDDVETKANHRIQPLKSVEKFNHNIWSRISKLKWALFSIRGAAIFGIDCLIQFAHLFISLVVYIEIHYWITQLKSTYN